MQKIKVGNEDIAPKIEINNKKQTSIKKKIEKS